MDKGGTQAHRLKEKKSMKMSKAVHLRDDTDRQYVPRKGGRRELAGIENCVDSRIRRLAEYTERVKKKKIVRLIVGVNNSNINLSKTTKTKKKKKKMARKTTVWILQATNWRDCAREDLDIVKKGKSLEGKRISINSTTKQCHKHQL